MPSKRKFYKMTLKVTILSESPFTGHENLKDLAEGMTDGNNVGTYEAIKNKEISSVQAVKELQALGSEPGFFMLSEDGQDSD